METTKRTVILLLLALLATGVTQSAEKQAAAASGTRAASCLVKITCDPAVLPLNLETVDYLFHSSGVGGKAARDILNISIDQVHDLFTIEYVQSSVSDDLGGVGMPPLPSRAGRSGIGEDEYGMMDYSNSPIPRGSSSVVNSPSRIQPGTGKSSSTRGTTASRTQPTTGTSYSRSRRDRGDLYGYVTTPTAPQQRIGTTIADPTNVQTDLFSLNVHLPEDIEPLAREYMNALVYNLRQVLTDAYDVYREDINTLIQFAESRRDHAQSQLANAMEQIKATELPPPIGRDPADVAVYERLEQIVDLSDLNASTAFVDVIEQLKTAVDPPLQIQPNWKDLLENGEVEQTTPAGMDPLPGIKLRKALEILLDGLSSDVAELKYVVDEDVIVIATRDRLPSKLVTRVYDISDFAYSAGSAKEVANAIQKTIEPESWYEISDMGEGTITPYPSQQPRKLAVLQTSEIHQKIQKFLESIRMDIPVGTPLDVPAEVHLRKQNNLLAEKQNLEMELARLQSRMPAIEEQIVRIKKEVDQKVHADQVSEELRKILAVQATYLERVKRLVEDGSVSNSELADAEEKLARARIELAMRREQIGASAGADQLSVFSRELAMLAVDTAEQKAMLEIVSNQLDRTEQQLTASTILDPKVSQIRLAVRALEIAERRINELNTLALNAQPPTVSVLGAE